MRSCRSVVLWVLPLLACGDDGSAGTSDGGTSSGGDESSSSSPTNITTGITSGISASMSDSANDTSDSDPATDSADTSGGPCSNAEPPMLLSMDSVTFPRSSDAVTVALTFDTEVTIAADGLLVDGGASITAPELPATGETFMVSVEGLQGPGPFTLTVDAAAVTETTCDATLEADATVDLAADCDTNTAPSLTAEAFHQLDGGTLTDTYVLTFDELVTLQEGALTVSGATIESIDPALPATADSFTVELSDLDGVAAVSLDADGVTDGCGAALASDAQVWVCTVTSVAFDHTGAAQSFVVPACAEGTLSVVAHGAAGQSVAVAGVGGLGAQASGDLAVTAGETLGIYVGGQTGFNGGGAPGMGGLGVSGQGGGASDVRQGGMELAERVLVAGGGGGGGAPPQGACGSTGGGDGGEGGGPDGTAGTVSGGCIGASTGGGGATQIVGGGGGTPTANCGVSPLAGGFGGLGLGGAGSDGTDCDGSGVTGSGGGGGGGGYYGGGGGAGGPGGATGGWGGAGGGGGSSYVDGVANGSTTPGTHSGDGDVTLSW